MREKTLALFKRYGFPSLAPDQEVRRLTLAERQIVEIAKGLASDPAHRYANAAEFLAALRTVG